MDELKEIIIKLLNEIEEKETNLSITGGRGYSAGKAH